MLFNFVSLLSIRLYIPRTQTRQLSEFVLTSSLSSKITTSIKQSLSSKHFLRPLSSSRSASKSNDYQHVEYSLNSPLYSRPNVTNKDSQSAPYFSTTPSSSKTLTNGEYFLVNPLPKELNTSSRAEIFLK